MNHKLNEQSAIHPKEITADAALAQFRAANTHLGTLLLENSTNCADTQFAFEDVEAAGRALHYARERENPVGMSMLGVTGLKEFLQSKFKHS